MTQVQEEIGNKDEQQEIISIEIHYMDEPSSRTRVLALNFYSLNSRTR